MIVRQILYGCAGLGLTIYAYYVKKQNEKNPNYKALCDLGENVSCTRVLTSKYDRGFGLIGALFGEHSLLNASNITFGMGYYLIQIVTGVIDEPRCHQLALASSIVACSGSIYLAGVLTFVLKDLCLVCVSSYLLNGALLRSNLQTISPRA